MSNLLAAIKAREAKVSGVRTGVIATLVVSPARFSAVELHVTPECLDRELLDRLVEIADRACIMMNTLRGTLDLRVQVGVAV
jgi:putative redox protein